MMLTMTTMRNAIARSAGSSNCNLLRLGNAGAAGGNVVEGLMSSLSVTTTTTPTRQQSSSTKRRKSTAAVTMPMPQEQKQEMKQEGQKAAVLSRFGPTAEVIVSKIFPAGFGWQAASVVAEQQLGLAANDAAFALVTGAGDFAGVFAGHSLYFAAKKALFPNANIDMKEQVQTGVLLASAAFCSGTVWQPSVNILQAADLSFAAVATGTAVVCGGAFYAGLRVFRRVLNAAGCEHVALPSYENLKADAQLSAAIGGATGAFVGTDVGYMNGAGNFLRPLVGVEDGMGALTGMVQAGKSTALGFAIAQTIQNVSYRKGNNWVD